RFCAKVISKDGYLFPKYSADGSWGSNAHSWISPDGKFQLPIQEDETALVLYSLWNHYDHARDIEFIDDLYDPLILKAADFLVNYRDDETKLPEPSYDLWEEQRGVSTFTASAVCCGLMGASRFAKLFGDSRKAERYKNASEEIRSAILKHLYDPEKKRFLKMLHPDEEGDMRKDATVDSSLYAIFEFEVLPPDDPRVISTMNAIESNLWVRTKVGGIARYENDPYQRISNDSAKVPGNPWPLCTLWLAEWYIANGDLQHGLKLLKWVADRGHESGILPEQVNPETNEPLSVAPLTWSHSTFVITVLEYLKKMRQEKNCPTCGLPAEKKKRGKLQ
ncbi:MAG TPA: glycoside hydrolase family 15 protein, partial [Methanomicrobiales archaeon]|nr:glycoside hydrolase family 15 protein [Methanomicrobiales archaeon]